MHAKRRESFLIASGAGVAMISLFSDWGLFQLGTHVSVFYRRVRGWDLPEGVLVWTLALIALGIAVSPFLSLPIKWRRALLIAGVVLAAMITFVALSFQLNARNRLWADARNTLLGDFAETEIPPDAILETKIGTLPLLVGAVLIASGSALALGWLPANRAEDE